MIMKLNDFFEKLAANASRNYKIATLEQHKNNTLLRDVVRLALDPFTQFYIRKIPEYTPQGVATLATALDSLYDLSSRIVTGNAAIEHLRSILSSLDESDAKVIERIIKKDLKCGFSVSTANKVWSGLLKSYPCMLCSPYNEKLVDKIEFPAMVQTKMDGMRFNAIVRSGKVEYRSRNGKEINLHKKLDEVFTNLAGNIDCVFDGELLVSDSTGEVLDRQTGNGILNKAVKGTITEEEASTVVATVWDCIPYLYFVDGLCPVDYKKRFQRLILATTNTLQSKVKHVQYWEVNSLDEANVLFQELLSGGEEGIILKDMRGAWEDKRAKHQIKFKGELDCDLKIVDTIQGTGKYEGMLGSVVCESADGVVNVNVGSGFNDEQRKTLVCEELIGKIVAVKYNARIKNKRGEESLFLPIFLEVREDKDHADSSGDIK
jgi:hypothetical protein